MKRLLVLLVFLLICSFIIVGCSSSTTPATTAPGVAPTTSAAVPVKTTPQAGGPQYGGTLRCIRNMGIANIGAPSDTPATTMTISLLSPVLESLVTNDAQGRILPSLAESIDVAPDGKVITFHLVKGVNFQDGTPFNAAAVKFNLELCLANKCASSAILTLVTSYEIPDDYTLKVNLSKYDARFLLTLAQTAIGEIASPTALQKPTNPQDIGKDHVVGTGPFKFDSWQTDQFIKMVKWDGYRIKGRPYLDAIEIRNNSDLTVSLMSFKAGEVNMVENIDPSQYNSLKKEGAAVAIPPLGFVFSIIPDGALPDSPFKDVKMRQAIEYAIDKVAMAEGIGLGTQFPAYQWAASPPLGQDAWYVADLAPRKFDVAKAKALIAEAGYPNGLNYPLISDVRARQDQVVAIQTYLKTVGINTTLDMADVARASTFGTKGWGKGIYIPGFPNFSSFSSWIQAFHDPVMTQPMRFKFAGWDEGWDAVAAEVDYDKRIAKMKDMMRQTYEQAVQIPYIQDGPRYVTDGNIMDMKWDATGVNGLFDAVNVWLKKK